VLRGCVPKKLLVYASQIRDILDDAAGYGWTIEGATIDWNRLIAAKNQELDRLEGIYRRMLAAAGVEIVEGRGRVVDPHMIEIAGRRITAERILVATGGGPVMPPIPGIEHAISSNEALELAQLPESIAVIGGGYIGVEFAGIWHGAGSKVTQLIRGDALLRGFDDDIRLALAEELRHKGIDLRTHTEVRAIERIESGLRLHLDHGGPCEVGAVLGATGRRPNSAGFGLADVGVVCDEWGGIKVDEWSRTSVPSIWAVGDVTQRVSLTPVAIADGRAFAETEFNANPTMVDHFAIPTAVFSQPPVGAVGLTEQEARQRGIDVVCYRSVFRPMKFVLPDRTEKTTMKLVVDRTTDRVLGVHMVGADAPEIIQGFAVALRCGATKKQFDATIGIHPSSAEEFVTMYKPMS